MRTDPIRVLIVDDSVVIRRLLSNIIDDDPDLEVAGVAQNGRIALDRIAQLDPDIVTLDVEMPELDGLGALKLLRETNRELPVIMFSTLTERGASATLDALSLGASDYVAKPANVGSVTVAMERVRAELIPKVKALCPAHREPSQIAVAAPPVQRAVPASDRVDVVAIGSSTGGPNALSEVIGALPADLAVPVVVAQHMPAVFTNFLAKRLDGSCALDVAEGVPDTLLAPGNVYIAPGDHHMVLKQRALGVHLDTNQDEPEHFCRPAVDVLFRSVAATFGGNVLAVILTGMGSDGRDGCAALRSLGAHVIAQDEASSVVWGMPGAVAGAGLADEILPLGDIGPAIARRVESGRLVTGRRSA